MKASISMIEGAIKSIKGGTSGAGGGMGAAGEANGVPIRDYGGEGGRETSGEKAETLEAVLQTFRQKHEEMITEEAAALKIQAVKRGKDARKRTDAMKAERADEEKKAAPEAPDEVLKNPCRFPSRDTTSMLRDLAAVLKAV